MDEIYELLRTAGARKQPVVECTKDSLGNCVHICWAGVNRAGGTHFCYQFGGTSDSGLREVGEGVGAWRCIVVEKLRAVELQSGIWHTEPRSNRQTCIAEVEFDADAQCGEDPQ